LENRKNIEEDTLSQSQWLELREELLQCLNSPNGHIKSKEIIRRLHESQRRERAIIEQKMLKKYGKEILPYFAEGNDINPSYIDPQIVLVNKSDSLEGNLFRAATLFWSVPVSRGYGRRMRYLVIDKQNNKLIGVFALGDPVFNLKCRDEWIGWDVHQRRKRLAFVLDAYVLGAIPPYSLMLGAKMIGSLLASEEIRVDFRNRYGNKAGLISRCEKDPYLVLITTTSSLGRSSIYNRLKLPGIVNFNRIGTTQGWGHFLVTDDVFKQVRSVLKDTGDPYFNNYKFGQGPNWRLRAIRKACQILHIDDNLLQHGIKREAYGIPLASNWREILKGEQQIPEEACYKAKEIADLALNRWVIPRTQRNTDWRHWSREDSWQTLTKYLPMLNE